MAGTSFGHLTTAEEVPTLRRRRSSSTTGSPAPFHLLNQHGVPWANYYQDVPQGIGFRNFLADPVHFRF
ncbi:MAG TPA: hypothetical protein VFR11_08440 [Micromonosporaceae bacterium]|jgi:hypothetical protein|nr:hypothetical protein [Micromonosporaceae bacterium]